MEDQPFDFNTPITEDITLIAQFDCPNGVTLTQFKTALDNGTAATTYPVGTQIDDTTNGSYDPLIVAHYGKGYGTDHNGAYLFRKYIYPVEKAWGDVGTYENSTINTWLNGDYFNSCSADIKAMAKQIHVPVVNGYVPAKIFLMSGVETMSLSGSADAGMVWDYWKEKTGLTSPSTVANTGRVMSAGELTNGHGEAWWLRTIDVTNGGAAQITGDGSCRLTPLTANPMGVVPALFIPVGDVTPTALTA